MVQQRDGKLLIGRWVYYWPTIEDLSVVRLTPDGRLDPTFGGDGLTGIDLGDMEGATRAVVQLADGRVVAAGRVSTDLDGTATRFGLARYLQNGAVDPSFGIRGAVIESLGATHASINALVELPDGRLVVAGGVTAPTGTHDMVVARFSANGPLDSTFGTSGKLVVDFSGVALDDAAHALVLQPDGKLVAAGYAFDANGSRKLAVLRLTPDGSLDATFGRNGLVTVDAPGASRSAKVALQLQSDGRLALTGQSEDTATEACSAVVASLNPDGSADVTFGGSGVVNLPLGQCAWEGGSSIAVEPSGAIIVGNTTGTPFIFSPADVRVARLTATGLLDDSFGVNGSTVIDMGLSGTNSRVDPNVGVSLVRHTDGRISVAASDQFDWDYGGNYFVIARLLASGSSAGLIGLTETYVGVDESTGSAAFIVRRTGGAAGAVSVDFATLNDTASGGVDFTVASGTLTWVDGETADKTITIAIADDSVSEGTEYLQLTLSNPTGGANLTTNQALLNIIDNESPPPAPPPSPSPGNPTSGGGGGVGWVLILVLAGVLAYRRTLMSAAREHTGPSGRFSI